jgi:prepilin-type N-terminal cleavage/methylation domain-containing protein
VTTWRRLARRFDRAREDRGFTLIELMVSILLLSVLMGIVTASIIGMFQGVRKTQGEATAIDANRAVVERLDKQIRFANAITSPGAGATAGTFYVEWQSGDTGQPQTCTQWRYVASTKALQARSWTEVPGAASPAWVTQILGVSPIAGQNVFQPGKPDPRLSAASQPQKQQLTVEFQTTAGLQQRTTRATELTVTAVNTTSSLAPTGICSDLNVTRP